MEKLAGYEKGNLETKRADQTNAILPSDLTIKKIKPNMKKAFSLLTLCSSLAVAQADVVKFDLAPNGLSPTNVVPAVTNSTGSGNTISGGIALQTTNSTLTFAIGYGAAAGFSNLTGQATAVSLNGPAPAGSNAPVLADLSPFTFPAIEPTNGGVISIGHVSCSEFTLNGQRWAVLHFRLTRRAGIGSLGA